jgi:hypothetical protein
VGVKFSLVLFIIVFNIFLTKYLFHINRNDGRVQKFSKTLIKDYVSDDLVRSIFSSYMVYTPATKDDRTALDILKSFLCRALSYHIGEKLGIGGSNHDTTLNGIKNLDHVTKDLVVKSRLYADTVNRI